MTIKEAIQQLFISEKFREDAKKDARLRVCLGRHNKGELKNGAIIELLEKYGYKTNVTGK